MQPKRIEATTYVTEVAPSFLEVTPKNSIVKRAHSGEIFGWVTSQQVFQVSCKGS